MLSSVLLPQPERADQRHDLAIGDGEADIA